MVNHSRQDSLKSSNSAPIAIFDLDYTLLSGDSEAMWSRFLFDQKVIDQYFLEQIINNYHTYEQGWLDIHEYEALLLRPLTEHPLPELFQLRLGYLKQIRLSVRNTMMRKVKHFRNMGFILLLITASNSFIAEPIATALGFPNLICTQVKRNGKYFTNQIEGVPAFREGKVRRLEQWLQEKGLSLVNSWGYSDSHNDLPLLSLVEHPVAVAPDFVLREHARKHGWKIINL